MKRATKRCIARPSRSLYIWASLPPIASHILHPRRSILLLTHEESKSRTCPLWILWVLRPFPGSDHSELYYFAPSSMSKDGHENFRSRVTKDDDTGTGCMGTLEVSFEFVYMGPECIDDMPCSFFKAEYSRTENNASSNDASWTMTTTCSSLYPKGPLLGFPLASRSSSHFPTLSAECCPPTSQPSYVSSPRPRVRSY